MLSVSRTLICPVCDVEFESKSPTARFCSKKCNTKYFNTRKSPPKIIRNLTCLICGKEFVTDDNKRKFCGPECGKKYTNIKKNKTALRTLDCPNCHKTFETYYPLKKFCSQSCSLEFIEKKKPNEQRSCLVCQKEFITNTKRKVFCSQKCQEKYHIIRKQQHKIKPIKNCLYCNEPFEISKPGGSKFCSLHCRNEWYAKNYFIKKEPPQKYCPICNSPINIDRHPLQIYCSNECFQNALSNNNLADSAKIKKCLYCNKVFEATNQKMKYCTSDCRLAYNANEVKNRYQKVGTLKHNKSTHAIFKKQQSNKILRKKVPDRNQHDKKDDFLAICMGCNFPFLATDKRQKYCSETCYKVSMIKERKLQKKLKKYRGKYV